ncbi:MAG: DUF6434 domain-containing protein [Sporolactobacillus sp.]
MRPNLTEDMAISDFKNYYWLKNELQTFCRQHGLRISGSKVEISNRIELFLTTGQPIQSGTKRAPRPVDPAKNTLSLETVIAPNHRCSQEEREFFKTVINPTFHFSTFIQNFFKNNVGKTYQDVVNAWFEEEERKKDPAYQTSIALQFEYNQFVRDFYRDPQNKGKSLQEAVRAWKLIKSLPGSNKYVIK